MDVRAFFCCRISSVELTCLPSIQPSPSPFLFERWTEAIRQTTVGVIPVVHLQLKLNRWRQKVSKMTIMHEVQQRQSTDAAILEVYLSALNAKSEKFLVFRLFRLARNSAHNSLRA